MYAIYRANVLPKMGVDCCFTATLKMVLEPRSSEKNGTRCIDRRGNLRAVSKDEILIKMIFYRDTQNGIANDALEGRRNFEAVDQWFWTRVGGFNPTA
jgi:hypothetical protein